MDLFLGIIFIAIALFVIYFAIAYQWLDKHRFSVERNFTKSKDIMTSWQAYAAEAFRDDEKIAPIVEKFAKEKKMVKKIDLLNQFQERLNIYCDGDDSSAAEYKKIRKTSYDILKEFVRVHNVLADEYNIKLEKEIVKPVIKIMRFKEVPKVYLNTNTSAYRKLLED